MNELALFAGAGGGMLGGKLLGWNTVCAVERDAFAAGVLAQRQNDGLLKPFPVWSDVTTFDGKPWNGIIDVVSGGFPCQDISAAGNGAGITGSRSGLWKEMARIVGEVRPQHVFVENSPMLTSRGLGVVLGDLASLGFDAEWGVLSAADVGAPHLRERIWILGSNTSFQRCNERGGDREERHVLRDFDRDAEKGEPERKRWKCWIGAACQNVAYPWEQYWNGRGSRACWWKREPEETLRDVGRGGRKEDGVSEPEPELGRVAYGLADTLDRIKAIGNGQVPECHATAFTILSGRLLNDA